MVKWVPVAAGAVGAVIGAASGAAGRVRRKRGHFSTAAVSTSPSIAGLGPRTRADPSMMPGARWGTDELCGDDLRCTQAVQSDRLTMYRFAEREDAVAAARDLGGRGLILSGWIVVRFEPGGLTVRRSAGSSRHAWTASTSGSPRAGWSADRSRGGYSYLQQGFLTAVASTPLAFRAKVAGRGTSRTARSAQTASSRRGQRHSCHDPRRCVTFWSQPVRTSGPDRDTQNGATCTPGSSRQPSSAPRHSSRMYVDCASQDVAAPRVYPEDG